jgi:hypothetical protein
MDYAEFVDRMANIKAMGYVPSHRKGPTGIGKTLEDLLGIKENNIPGPDFTMHELKSARVNSASMITLFTKSPKPKAVNTILRNTYGYMVKVEIAGSKRFKHVKNDPRQTTLAGESVIQPEEISSRFIEDLELHTTVDASKFNNLDFKIEISKDRIILLNKKNIEVYWDSELLREAFEEKYHRLAYVLAECKKINEKEHFWYTSGLLLEGFSFDKFTEILEKGTLKVDIRLGHHTDGRRHDHGTGFRIMERYLPLCFSKIIKMGF